MWSKAEYKDSEGKN